MFREYEVDLAVAFQAWVQRVGALEVADELDARPSQVRQQSKEVANGGYLTGAVRDGMDARYQAQQAQLAAARETFEQRANEGRWEEGSKSEPEGHVTGQSTAGGGENVMKNSSRECADADATDAAKSSGTMDHADVQSPSHEITVLGGDNEGSAAGSREHVSKPVSGMAGEAPASSTRSHETSESSSSPVLGDPNQSGSDAVISEGNPSASTVNPTDRESTSPATEKPDVSAETLAMAHAFMWGLTDEEPPTGEAGLPYWRQEIRRRYAGFVIPPQASEAHRTAREHLEERVVNVVPIRPYADEADFFTEPVAQELATWRSYRQVLSLSTEQGTWLHPEELGQPLFQLELEFYTLITEYWLIDECGLTLPPATAEYSDIQRLQELTWRQGLIESLQEEKLHYRKRSRVMRRFLWLPYHLLRLVAFRGRPSDIPM